MFVKKGQYGAIQILPKDSSDPRKLMLAVNPPSCEDLRRYNGYPSCPVCVSFKKGRGYSFVQIPSFINGECGFMLPHGPCTICFVTMQKGTESSYGLGISAQLK
ncbi:hypothetical protein AVEN_122809-1 [Araneus ventricosus]|uniref:Uncharacterized protein n=1 Tax=Araneus ventricosus TaxID=182803 RepID=A0A4Y2MI45_ARAVE|nr:hypothetical protein AVEN_122809-1 [Araneus ventricosus]